MHADAVTSYAGAIARVRALIEESDDAGPDGDVYVKYDAKLRTALFDACRWEYDREDGGREYSGWFAHHDRGYLEWWVRMGPEA